MFLRKKKINRIITEENVEAEMKRYPMDGIVYSEKCCPTCDIPRPARSKHCRCLVGFLFPVFLTYYVCVCVCV
jgi:hypothetical protein